MADSKLSALPENTAPALTDEFYINDGGVSKKIKLQNFSETGTFTPTIYGSTTAGTNTYTVQSGNYSRIGKLVQFNIRLQMSSKDGAMSGAIRIGGLPYTCKTTDGHTPVSFSWLTDITLTSNYMLTGYIEAGSTHIRLTETNGTAEVFITDADIANTSRLMISGCYQAA